MYHIMPLLHLLRGSILGPMIIGCVIANLGMSFVFTTLVLSR